MICRLFVAAFFSLLNIGTVYPILSLHKKALTRHRAASEPAMYFIKRKNKSDVVADPGDGHFGKAQRFRLGLLAAGGVYHHLQQFAAKLIQSLGTVD